jgi:hypothetical protein
LGKVGFLSGLVLVVFLVFMVANMEQVWAAVTFNPNPPVDGQPFTITSSVGSGTSLSVYGSCGCSGVCGISAGASPYTVTFAAGQYNVFDSGDFSCTSFTVVPAAAPEYPHGLAVGGTMLPVNQVRVVLPWLTLLALFGTVSVWVLVTKRKTRN